jgi:hypothetical protein
MVSDDLNKLIKERIENFLGYGDPSSPIWLIGMEEGVPKDLSAQDYIRMFNKNSENTFRDIEYSAWGDITKSTKPFWGKNYYKMWRLLLFLGGNKDSFENSVHAEKMQELKRFLGKSNKGPVHSNCLLEFNPIPFYKGKSILWSNYVIAEHKNLDNFLDKMQKDRVDLIRKNIDMFGPKLIICYGVSGEYLGGFKKLSDSEFEEISIDKIKIYHSKFRDTNIFIIPHPSDWSRISDKTYHSIGKEILLKSKM